MRTASDSGGWSRTFAYDPYGNMWLTGNSGIAVAGTTPTANVYNANSNRVNTMAYDGAGNQTVVNGNSASYDGENRLVTVTEAPAFGGGSETLLYDGLGQRVKKTMGSAVTVYVYDAGGQLAAEYATATNTPPCQTCYLSRDHLGSVRLVTDGNGNVVARHDYLPFGEEVPANTAGRNAQFGVTDNLDPKFTGQMRDSESGLDFFNARYFSAAQGRFTSPDPGSMDLSNPQSFNRYSYVRNNPMNATDPSGMDTCSDGSWASVCVTDTAPPDLESVCWWCWEYGYPYTGSNGGSGGSGVPTYTVTSTAKAPPGNSQQPPKNRTCPAVPAHPANYPPQALYDLGVNASKSVYDNLSPDLAKTLAYGALVAPGQPLDFKNQPFQGANPQYRAYGKLCIRCVR